MRRKSVLFFLCALVSLGTALWAQKPAPATLHYEVKMKSASFGNMGVRKLWIKGDNMRWEQKSARLPIVLVKNPKGVFLIHPWNKVAAQYPKGTPRGNPRALLPGPIGSVKAFLKEVKATKHGQETVGKQRCDVYPYTDPVTKRACKLWLNAKSGKPVQLYIKGLKGKEDTITVTYVKFESGLKISDSLFELPKGYAVRPMPKLDLTSKKPGAKLNKSKPG